jgi:uncharacterized protein (TIGR02453 family)
MGDHIKFTGFTEECLTFLKDLSLNNDPGWFQEHRADYDKFVLEPSRAFVADMGERLKAIRPEINADPRINRSLFRINRDIRFSKDKTPYKTHMALWFWEGSGKRMECSGYYLHVEPKHIMLGAGIYVFPKKLLDSYRKRVMDEQHGPELVRILADQERRGSHVGGIQYKRIPNGYPADHPRAELLKYNGLYAGVAVPVPEEFTSDALLDFCFKWYTGMTPLHEWLLELTG